MTFVDEELNRRIDLSIKAHAEWLHRQIWGSGKSVKRLNSECEDYPDILSIASEIDEEFVRN